MVAHAVREHPSPREVRPLSDAAHAPTYQDQEAPQQGRKASQVAQGVSALRADPPRGHAETSETHRDGDTPGEEGRTVAADGMVGLRTTRRHSGDQGHRGCHTGGTGRSRRGAPRRRNEQRAAPGRPDRGHRRVPHPRPVRRQAVRDRRAPPRAGRFPSRGGCHDRAPRPASAASGHGHRFTGTVRGDRGTGRALRGLATRLRGRGHRQTRPRRPAASRGDHRRRNERHGGGR